ncbi:ATP-grasp domain-containing protein [Pacificimonas sp. WHA3]|uniref:ATP-grasp domain-containing protein n=1 Tax=Pacificimonas pallii TaxID=2827236 RepID=A0ABS6SE51_9SPHN|nr:ATP-grasp domain-containing protein [Pacificimonas pallii]MBV7256127.1 ATP-grasp domain-containing protein [Pacificimonas pallii]
MGKAVLITGARAAAALDMARDFTTAGWDVHLADSVPVRMARWSSVPATHHLYPAPRQEGTAFQACIERLVDAHHIDLIVPTCEEVFHLAAPALTEAIGDRLFAPDVGMLAKLHDKLQFAQAAAEWGLTSPESHVIDSAEDLERFATNSRDWVFKPRMSRFGEQTLVAPEARALELVNPQGWMAQKYVRGEEACVHAVAHNGELVACSSYSSRWRLNGGASFVFEPLDEARHEQLLEVAKTLIERGALHGQFGFDVIFDESGRPNLLECNPRATSGVHLLVGDGQLARSIGLGEPTPETPPETCYLGLAMVLFGLPQAFANGRLCEWRETWQKGRDVLSRSSDRKPILGALIDAGLFALTGFKHGMSTNAATTYDIEWNGEEFA